MAALRLLSIAVGSGKVAYVYLVGDQLMDWRISDRASVSPKTAARMVQTWISDQRPEAVATEKIDTAKRKGDKTKELIAAMAKVAANNYLLDVSVAREHPFANKYEEAAALADRYPELLPWVPKKRRLFDNEPRNTVLFEALAQALVVLRGPKPSIAPSFL